MSRPRRYSPGGMVFHVLNRGVGRRMLFTKDEDFLAFERVVEESLVAGKGTPITARESRPGFSDFPES